MDSSHKKCSPSLKKKKSRKTSLKFLNSKSVHSTSEKGIKKVGISQNCLRATIYTIVECKRQKIENFHKMKVDLIEKIYFFYLPLKIYLYAYIFVLHNFLHCTILLFSHLA